MSRFPFRTPEKLSIDSLQSELSSLIGRWWHCGLATGPLDGQDWAPPVELTETRDEYCVTIELPGVTQSGIELTAQETSLLISGEKLNPICPCPPSEADETSAKRVLHCERRYGQFRRTIDLPGPVRVDDVSAILADGVLLVTLPKAPGAAVHEVPIQIRTSPAQ